VAGDDTGEVAIAAEVHEVVANLPIQVDGAELFRKFDGQYEAGAAGRDASIDRAVGIIQRNLRKHGHGEAGFLIVVKSPFETQLILAQAVLGISQGVVDAEVGVFEGELDAVAEAEIDVDVRRMGDRLRVIEEGHVAQIDFPLLVSGRAGIVGVIGWAALGKDDGGSAEEEKDGKRPGYWTADSAGDSGPDERLQRCDEGPNGHHGWEFIVFQKHVQRKMETRFGLTRALARAGRRVRILLELLGAAGRICNERRGGPSNLLTMAIGAETIDDGLLVRRMMAGDEESFTLLYRRKHPAIYRFALHMSGNTAVAEDVTQEVFMTLIRDGQRFDPALGTLGGFLFGIARNHLRRRWDQERGAVPLPGTAEELDAILLSHAGRRNGSTGNGNGNGHGVAAFPDHSDEMVSRENIQRVRQAIATLPENYREVVVLCEMDEMSYEDAAAVLECPIGTVRSRLHRAKSMLTEKLREAEPAARKSAVGL
jgi:RNA polymerase sigma-70 factor (ECF subfamily)